MQRITEVLFVTREKICMMKDHLELKSVLEGLKKISFLRHVHGKRRTK